MHTCCTPRGHARGDSHVDTHLSSPSSLFHLFLYSQVDMEMEINDQHYFRKEGRPYRSHLHPACFPCKKRRSRCRTQNSSDVCMMCQTHGTNCVFPHSDDSYQPRVRISPRKRQQFTHRGSSTLYTLSQPADVATSTRTGLDPLVNPPQMTATRRDDSRTEELPNLVGIAEAGDDSSHIVSPATAGDNDILESYLSAVPTTRSRCLARTSTSSTLDRPLRPVRFNLVPRKPLGVAVNQSPAASKCEVIEKYMDPNIHEYLNLWVPNSLWSTYSDQF